MIWDKYLKIIFNQLDWYEFIKFVFIGLLFALLLFSSINLYFLNQYLAARNKLEGMSSDRKLLLEIDGLLKAHSNDVKTNIAEIKQYVNELQMQENTKLQYINQNTNALTKFKDDQFNRNKITDDQLKMLNKQIDLLDKKIDMLANTLLQDLNEKKKTNK